MRRPLEQRIKTILNRVKTPGSGEAGHAQRIPDAINEVARDVDSVEKRVAVLEAKLDQRGAESRG
jgi:hypothetical protein